MYMYEAEICGILLPLRCPFWFIFWPKTMDYIIIIRGFDRNGGHLLRSSYSSLEGAMKLKL